MRFGIEMSTDHTLEEVGKQFDVTRERIRQIEAKALRKLRHPSRSDKLKSFLEGTDFQRLSCERRRHPRDAGGVCCYNAGPASSSGQRVTRFSSGLVAQRLEQSTHNSLPSRLYVFVRCCFIREYML